MSVPVVVEGVTPTPLVTVDDLAARLGVTLSAPVDVARAQAALDDALGLAQGFTLQRLEYVADDVAVLPQPTGYDRTLWLPESPVVAVTAVTLGSVPLTNWEVTGDGIYRYFGWRRYSDTSWLQSPSVTVTYSHGFQTCPGDLKAALLSMAQLQWENPSGRRQVRQGDTSITYELSALPAGAVSPAHMATLRRYRKAQRSVALHNTATYR